MLLLLLVKFPGIKALNYLFMVVMDKFKVETLMEKIRFRLKGEFCSWDVPPTAVVSDLQSDTVYYKDL